MHFCVSYFHFHFYQFLASLNFSIPNDRECNFLLFSYWWRWAKTKGLSDTFQLMKRFKKDRTFPHPPRVLIEKPLPGSNLHFQWTIPKDKTLEIWFSIENNLNLVKLSKIRKNVKEKFSRGKASVSLSPSIRRVRLPLCIKSFKIRI